MGNSCFLNNFKINQCCLNKNIVTSLSKSDQVLTKDIPQNEESKEKDVETKNENNNKLYNIINYFNVEEKEILAEYYKQRDKEKQDTKNKLNNKYELIYKKLLEQQNIKIVGPKRRQTIRKESDKIISMVKQILKENKEEGLTTNTKEKESEDITLLMNNSNKKGRWSTTIDKSFLINNHLKKEQYNLIKEDA